MGSASLGQRVLDYDEGAGIRYGNWIQRRGLPGYTDISTIHTNWKQKPILYDFN